MERATKVLPQTPRGEEEEDVDQNGDDDDDGTITEAERRSRKLMLSRLRSSRNIIEQQKSNSKLCQWKAPQLAGTILAKTAYPRRYPNLRRLKLRRQLERRVWGLADFVGFVVLLHTYAIIPLAAPRGVWTLEWVPARAHLDAYACT